MPPLQDTVVIDTSEKEIDMEYVCHIDTSYFNCGKYEMEVVYSSVVSPGLPESSDNYTAGRFRDITINVNMNDSCVTTTADTFKLAMKYSIDITQRAMGFVNLVKLNPDYNDSTYAIRSSISPAVSFAAASLCPSSSTISRTLPIDPRCPYGPVRHASTREGV